ncbi:MAG: hypothetical protein FWH48_00185 [Oscillospiraceae bacterium]|nr:hypothetical protein [Oscillospiraceae bacterium]
MADEEVFYKQCAAIEKHIKGLEKEELLEDVDGSVFQIYLLNGKKIKVSNSMSVDSVYVESEMDIEPFFVEIHEGSAEVYAKKLQKAI